MDGKKTQQWTAKFPKRGDVGYYWFRSDALGGEAIIEISGGAPNVEQVVYIGEDRLSKRRFISEFGNGEFYGPLSLSDAAFQRGAEAMRKACVAKAQEIAKQYEGFAIDSFTHQREQTATEVSAALETITVEGES